MSYGAPLITLLVTQKCKSRLEKKMDFNIFFLRARNALTSFASEAKAEPRTPGFIKPKKIFGNNFWKDPLSFLKSELKESGNI